MSQIYTTDLVGKKESVVDEILLISPAKTPMLNLLGFAAPIAQTSHQWFEDKTFADKSTITEQLFIDGAEVYVADTEPFRVDDVIKIGEERLLVLAIDKAGKKLSVQRNYANTEGANYVVGSVIEVMFSEAEEGLDARASRYKARTPKGNITQIFTDSIRVSGTAQEIEQYGISDLYSYEKAKVQLGLALQLEKALINGVKYENGTLRQMDGIRNFIKTNVIEAAGEEITDAMLTDLAQSVFDATGVEAAGGNYVLVVSPKQKRKISDFGKADIRLERKDNGRGQVVDHYISDFGEFEIVMNPNLDGGEVVLLDAARAAVRPVKNRDFFHKFLGDKGDYVEGMITGEYTLEFKQEEAHARIKGLK